ncbi:helix-turn-helix domain-containing protein [Candidatus Magnetominusculus xianensis]|uniref:helix-turn-helix domain-containing protein n=1 Tax=Candidatus Magnetominusculus xianensis TaxID=1748249 RepID=UPI000A117112|nr:helix-turn-helix transcriptional regulator [Nitrospirota bacterium]
MGLLGHDFLKELRLNEGYSLDALSKRTGLSPSHIKKIEDGQSMPGVDTLFDLCKGLNITIYDFFEHIGVSLYRSPNIIIAPTPSEERRKTRGVAVQGFEPRTLRI